MRNHNAPAEFHQRRFSSFSIIEVVRAALHFWRTNGASKALKGNKMNLKDGVGPGEMPRGGGSERQGKKSKSPEAGLHDRFLLETHE